MKSRVGSERGTTEDEGTAAVNGHACGGSHGGGKIPRVVERAGIRTKGMAALLEVVEERVPHALGAPLVLLIVEGHGGEGVQARRAEGQAEGRRALTGRGGGRKSGADGA